VSELQSPSPTYEDEIDLRKVIRTLWAGKTMIILCTVAVAAASVAYALLATRIYR